MICIACAQDKAIENFYFRRDTGRYKNICKECCINGKKKIKSGTHKKCKHCGEEKIFSEYQKAGGGKWLQPYCKTCDSIRKKKHERENIDRYKTKRKEYYLNNRQLVDPEQKEITKKAVIENLKIASKKYWNSTPKLSDEERSKRKSESSKKYREQNIEIIRARKMTYYKQKGLEQSKLWQQKMMNNVEFRIKKNLRGRVYVALKRGIKSEGTIKLLGCTIEDFKIYFQSLFKEGMTWDKYMSGEIVIDHIKPCALFNLSIPEEQKKCFHYTNLQPLWKLDNLIKGKKYGVENTRDFM